MADATVRASSAPTLTASLTQTIAFAGTPQTGDPIGIWITTNGTSSTLASTPTGWTLAYSVNFGTATRIFLHKKWASGDSTGVSVTFNAAPGGPSCACVVLDGSVHSDFGTIGTITTRGSTIATTTAVQTGATSAPNLVVSHEKASAHATPPTVSPTTTAIQNVTNAAASSGSVYVGSYDTSSGLADRTITYPTSSSNGAAYQVGLVPSTYSGAGTSAATSTSTGAAFSQQVGAGSSAGVSTGLGAAISLAFAAGITVATSAGAGAATQAAVGAGTSSAVSDGTGAAGSTQTGAGASDATSASAGAAAVIAAGAGQTDAVSGGAGAGEPFTPAEPRNLTVTSVGHQRTLTATGHQRTLTATGHRATLTAVDRS